MRIPGLTERAIRANAETASIERGRAYFEDGAVKSLRRRSEDEVEVFVQGTNIAPYRVDVRHNEDGVTSAECTCPYVTGSWCRHIVAALFAVMDSEGALSGPVRDMLNAFDRAELIRLVERMVDGHPAVASMLEDAYREKETR